MIRFGRQPRAANDRGGRTAPKHKEPSQPVPDGRYFFEICKVRPPSQVEEPAETTLWLWRLMSPAGAAVIECDGYADEKSCRDAVALLREKAGAAEVSLSA